ncbi:MAG: hypothetical protein U0797_23080 [Gemmataceae bacterium]
MSDHADKTVAGILTEKKGSVKNAPLGHGGPNWDDIMDLTWEEVVDRAKRRVPGYKTIKKLLASKEYDK